MKWGMWMKKWLFSFLVVIVLTNFIFLNPNYAYEDVEQTVTMDDLDGFSNNGIANVNGSEMSIGSIGSSQVGVHMGFIVNFINIFPVMGQLLVTGFISSSGVIDSNIVDDDYGLFNIENIITGKYVFFDANIFRDIKKDANLSSKAIMIKFRDNVKMWFIIVRDLAIVFNLCVLLYIASRMAIATIASDKAKYKEMLYNWAVSMAILFFIPYMMSAINWVSELLVDFARFCMNAIPGESFERSIMEQLIENLFSASGMKAAFYTIIYWILIWNELKFFTMYTKRMLTSFFLVVIAPFITVTYSVDKIADKKAQAFDKWLHEYLMNMFIQPIHCFTYLVFMFMAGNIAKGAPVVGVIFLMTLTKAEKIILSILGLSGSTLRQVGDEFSMKNFTGKLKGLIPKGMPRPGM